VVVYLQAWAVQEVLPASLKKTERRNKLVARKSRRDVKRLVQPVLEKRRRTRVSRLQPNYPK
jgi:hypothetical protein